MSDTYEAALVVTDAINRLTEEVRQLRELLREMQAELIALVETVAAKAR